MTVSPNRCSVHTRQSSSALVANGCFHLPHEKLTSWDSRLAAGDGLDRAEETDACLAQKIAWVPQAAADRFGQLELALLIWAVAVTKDRRGGAERMAARTGRSVDHILESPYFLIGTVDAIVDKLLEQRERHGVSYISVFPSDAFAPVVARLGGK